MFKIPLHDLKEKITQSGKIQASELDARIKAKINELSGLISEEGAAHIIANELGIQLMPSAEEQLKIKEIYAGMRGISCAGKVIRKFDTREFSKNDRTGRVCNLIIGDETGTIRIVFWNDQVDIAERLQENDVVLLKDVHVKENQGNPELAVNDRTLVEVNPKDIVIESVRRGGNFERRKLDELQDGQEGVEVVGTVVQVFDPRFFELCPKCNKRVQQSEAGWQCNEHGAVEPVLSYNLNLILDDGSSTIRTLFWKNQLHHLLGKQEQDLAPYRDNPAAFEDIKTDLLGEQLKLLGRVKRNDMFDRLEFTVQMVEKANPEEELARMEKGITSSHNPSL